MPYILIALGLIDLMGFVVYITLNIRQFNSVSTWIAAALIILNGFILIYLGMLGLRVDKIEIALAKKGIMKTKLTIPDNEAKFISGDKAKLKQEVTIQDQSFPSGTIVVIEMLNADNTYKVLFPETGLKANIAECDLGKMDENE